jgi:hypothetical protein
MVLQLLEPKFETFNRFYKTVQVTKDANIQALPRIKTLPAFSVRLQKESLCSIFQDQLPVDAKIQRIDFAIDVPTLEDALEFVIRKPKTEARKKYSSMVDSGTGTTFYFTSELDIKRELSAQEKEQAAKKARSNAVFERVYFKEDRGGVWRYELEFKPRAGRKHNIFNKAAPEIIDLYNEVLSNCTLQGSFKKEDFESLCITKARREWIEIHILSDWVPVTHLFYVALNDKERTYFNKFCNLNRDNKRCQDWLECARDYDNYHWFRMSIQ